MMRKPLFFKSKSATILIVALWALGTLSVFAVYLGIGVRQKILLVSRIENRDRLRLIGESGIKKALIILNKDYGENDPLSALSKATRHNNSDYFSERRLGKGFYNISYKQFDDFATSSEKYFGIIDEERKLNVNTADATMIKELIKYVLRWQDDYAKKLANAIVDWREPGDNELFGFYSENYYENLEYPYPKKNNEFEVIDELLLVEGMSERILQQLKPFITVYGLGKVNINTASVAVLKAIGFSDEVIDKIVFVRRGPDGVEATQDDLIFPATRHVMPFVAETVKLKPEEIAEIEGMKEKGGFTTLSYIYNIQSHARLANDNSGITVHCIFDIRSGTIEYWREVYQSL